MKTMKEYISTVEGVNQMWSKINEVLDNFDFTKVKAVMEALDWTWACNKEDGKEYEDQGCIVEWDYSGGKTYCQYKPEYPQLLRNARGILVQAIEGMPDDETEWSVGTGGFECRVWINDEPEGDGEDNFKNSVDLRLSFIIEDITTY